MTDPAICRTASRQKRLLERTKNQVVMKFGYCAPLMQHLLRHGKSQQINNSNLQGEENELDGATAVPVNLKVEPHECIENGVVFT
jgi:hypothetical protein